MFLIAGCIEPLEVKIDQKDERLVVDGTINDEPGPYTITLTKTQQVPYTPQKIPTEDKAQVSVTDDLGRVYNLQQTGPGTYQTPTGFRGQVGRTYTLNIITATGERFASEPETLQAVPEIENISYEVEKRIALDKNKQPQEVFWLNAYINTKDRAAEKNYYKWEYEVVYQVETQPWDYCEPAPLQISCTPRPKRCCQTCWVTMLNDVISIQNDRLVDGKELKKQLVTKIPINSQTFGTRVYLEIKQYSVSEKAYDFLNILKTQLNSVSSIQSPPPAAVEGNMTNLSAGSAKPLGFFSASAVKRKSIFIDPQTLGLHLRYFEYPDDCRELAGSSSTKPSYW